MGSNVDAIKERLDIVEIISSYTKLEKAGTNYKARCPFHNEKTPSFYVSPSRQTYYCFGCGAKGDMFSFVQEMEGLDFRGAMKELAAKAGVELEYERKAVKTEKEKLEHILLEASNFFKGNLKNFPEAGKYLEKRGLSVETIEDWGLGYAPDEWRLLNTHLLSLGYPQDLIIKAGLAKLPEEKGKNPYDIFRDRIIFPIKDASGKIVAFSGRALGKDTEPKYLNTPETALFHKSETLYGLDKAKEEIRKKDYTILVEGNIDLLLAHQVGVKNVVAACGTAFTPSHLERLKRLSSKIMLSFDGDKAGEAAAYKSSILALSFGMDAKVAEIPDGLDPADAIEKDPAIWKGALKQSKPAVEFFLLKIASMEKDDRKRGKLIVSRVLPLITLLPSAIERSHFVSMVARTGGLREEAVWEDLKKVKLPDLVNSEKGEEEEKRKEAGPKLPRKTNIERRLAGIVYWQESLPMPAVDVSSLKNEIAARTSNEYLKNMLEALEIEKENLIFEAESYYADPERLPKDIVELLDNFSDDLLREDLARHIRDLSLAEAQKDEKAQEELSKEIQTIHSKMRALEERRKVL